MDNKKSKNVKSFFILILLISTMFFLIIKSDNIKAYQPIPDDFERGDFVTLRKLPTLVKYILNFSGEVREMDNKK